MSDLRASNQECSHRRNDVIIGSVLTSVLVLIALSVTAYVIWRRRRNRKLGHLLAPRPFFLASPPHTHRRTPTRTPSSTSSRTYSSAHHPSKALLRTPSPEHEPASRQYSVLGTAGSSRTPAPAQEKQQEQQQRALRVHIPARSPPPTAQTYWTAAEPVVHSPTTTLFEPAKPAATFRPQPAPPLPPTPPQWPGYTVLRPWQST